MQVGFKSRDIQKEIPIRYFILTFLIPYMYYIYTVKQTLDIYDRSVQFNIK